MNTQRAITIRLTLISVGTAAVLFVADLAFPLGVAAGVPYVALVLIAGSFPTRRPVVYAAGAGTVLTIAGYFLSPAGGISWMVIVNR